MDLHCIRHARNMENFWLNIMTPAPRLLAAILRRFDKVAITLPPFGIYYVLPGNVITQRLVKHEQAHWAQYQRMGAVRFYATYLWQCARYSYHNAPMEIEARVAELKG